MEYGSEGKGSPVPDCSGGSTTLFSALGFGIHGVSCDSNDVDPQWEGGAGLGLFYVTFGGQSHIKIEL